MKISEKISYYGKNLPKSSIKKTLKSFYYASRPLDTISYKPARQNFFTRVKKFFKAFYNANSY